MGQEDPGPAVLIWCAGRFPSRAAARSAGEGSPPRRALAPRRGSRQLEGIDVANGCHHFLTAKSQLRATSELSKCSWGGYDRTAQRLVRIFGQSRLVSDLRSDDFRDLRSDITSRHGPVETGNEIDRVRCIAKFCFDAELIDRPARLGPTFKRPSTTTIRIERAKTGKRMFTDQLHQLIAHASLQLAGMILLAIHCGLGNGDVAQLRTWHVDLATGWLDLPKPKTGSTTVQVMAGNDVCT